MEGLVAVESKMHVINYCLNKFCPYVIILGTLFLNSNLEIWKGLLVFAFCLFIDKFSFKAGYSVAYCESRGIDLGNQPNDKDIK